MALRQQIARGIIKAISEQIRQDPDMRAAYEQSQQITSFTLEADTIARNIIDNSKRVKLILNELDKSIDGAYLYEAQKKHFINERIYLAIRTIKHLVKEAYNTAKTNYQVGKPYKKYAAELDANTAIHEGDDIPDFITARYPDVDIRKQSDEYKHIRRFDSLANLLTLNAKLSVCTAIAVHNNKLYISLNASSPAAREEIAIAISQRIQAINDYLIKLKTIPENEFDESSSELSEELYEELIKPYGYGIPKDVVMQAIDKFTDAVMYDQKTFSPDVKNALTTNLMNYRLLLPALDNPGGKPGMIILTHDEIIGDAIKKEKKGNKTVPKFNDNIKPITIETAQKCGSITDIHAEQLIAYNIFIREKSDKYSTENPFDLGISKLCCRTCKANLESLEFIRVRGEHGILYETTTSLLPGANQELLRHMSTPKKGPTEPRRSPPNSARKRRNPESDKLGPDELEENAQTSATEPPSHLNRKQKVARKLFFDEPENGKEKEEKTSTAPTLPPPDNERPKR